MLQEKKLVGVILSKTEVKDTDVLFSFLSQEQGKITVCARGAKKGTSKQGAFLQVGAILQIEIVRSASDIATLRGVKSIFMPENLSYPDLILFEESIDLTQHLCRQNHILDQAIRELMNFLPFFCHSSQKTLINFSYQLKLLTALGFLGSLRKCSLCQTMLKENEHWFRLNARFVCKQCSKSADEQVSFPEFKVFLCLQEQPYEFIEKLVSSPAFLKSIQQKQIFFHVL